MSKLIDMTGMRLGSIVIIARAAHRGNGKPRTAWLCRCDCGKEFIERRDRLLDRNIIKCASCRHAKTSIDIATSMAEYGVRKAMIQRCTKPNSAEYHNYGGRGIRVCNRWLESFSNFIEDMGRRPSKIHSIDRIENNGNYEPSNCRWATPEEQSNNRRNNVFYTHHGESKTIRQWSASTGLSCDVLRGRLEKLGWSTSKALTTPHTPRSGRLIEYKGCFRTIPEWSRLLGLNAHTVRGRIRSGMTVSEALNGCGHGG